MIFIILHLLLFSLLFATRHAPEKFPVYVILIKAFQKTYLNITNIAILIDLSLYL